MSRTKFAPETIRAIAEIDYRNHPCYVAQMVDDDWKSNWKETELTDGELEEVWWDRFSDNIAGGDMSMEQAIDIRKKLKASGHLKRFKEFLLSYREKHGESPSPDAIDEWHAANPKDDLFDTE